MRKLKNGGRDNRHKALLGADGAVVGPFILAAAGINVAGQAAAASIGANAAKNAAEEQAKATVESAQRNAQALMLQSENNKELQNKSMDFTKQQNEENRDIQKDIQMSLQMMTGQESMANRKQASKIQVRNGGGTSKRKLRSAGAISSLRGSNIPFTVLDGGGVIPIGVTPEGFDLYELYGNDHEHYHKAQDGKSKTGVGIKFNNGDVIEGEGNQNSNTGELLLTTPEGGYFISKHSINGFNPAEAVRQGMHPAIAFQTQEAIKDINGISDDGKHNKSMKNKRKLRLAGGDVNNIMTQYFPQGLDFSTDISAPSAAGVTYSLQNQDNRPKSKNGCSTRHTLSRGKAVKGFYSGNPDLRYANVFYDGPSYTNSGSGTTGGGTTGGFGNWVNNNAQLVGAGINTFGNIGGALITNWGNNRAANVLADAYGQAANITADAYSRMTGIDMSNLKKEDYAAAHYLPAIRYAFYNANPELAASERKRTRLRGAVKRNSLSSAAMLSRLGKIEVDSADERNRIYADKANKEEAIHQANNQAINEAARTNAMLDTQANRDYANAYLNLLQYNNDINNEKIAGIAQARSAGLTNAAGVRASTRQANANAWANALMQSALGFGNTFSALGKQREDRNNIMLGASNDAYYRNLWLRGTTSEKAAARAKLSDLINRTSGKTKEQYQLWYDMIS